MIRLALIGCSNAASYAAVSSRLTGAAITAVADADPVAAIAAQVAFGALASGSSLEGLLADNGDSFDAVVVDEPAQCRAQLATRAAEAGKHVLVETPIAMTTNEADGVVGAASKAGVRLMAGNLGRFAAAGATVKEALDSGELGEPGLLRIHRWEPLDNGSWPALDQEQGSVAVRNLSAEIDLAVWLFGGPPTEVYATGRRVSHGGIDQPDYVQVHLGFDGDGMSVIDYSASLPDAPGYHFLSMIGSKGAAYADDHHNVNLVYGDGGTRALASGHGAGHILAQLQELVDAISEDRDPAPTGADGRRAVLVAEAAAESMCSGGTARLAGGQYGLD
jgi:predicted dehydrogenase